ncbi:MAG: TonB-dependent siderophore receptor [Kangiellaceae bacterium]
MNINGSLALLVALLFMVFSVSAQQPDQPLEEEASEEGEKLYITGVRLNRSSKGATGLDMEINETPQSISVISNELIESFAANNLNDALKLATGVTVEEWETNRTNYTSRGFDIKNTQIDGVGMPNNWGIVTGAMESFGFQKIEVIRGANGLLTGVGNAAGTINYVRKRPTNKNEGEVGLSLGSYNLKRVQADYSALLTESGSWAGRIVAVAEDSESHLKGLTNDRAFVYGVVDGQLTDNSTLTVGYTYQDTNSNGNLWGGLVLNYSDGTQAEFDTSATTSQQWTQWDTENHSGFVEYSHMLNDWEIKATYNYRSAQDPAKLFYVFGTIDRETGLGLSGWPGNYEDEFDADLFDVSVYGEYSLFGLEHELNLGMSDSKSSNLSYTRAALSGFGATPAFPYPLDVIPEPEWGERTLYSNIDMSLKRFYGSTKINLSESFFVIAGFNAIDFTREGLNSGVVIDNDESEVSPYIGATYSVTQDINTYVSYSDIYQPQEQYDFDGYFLDPTKGINFEVGAKVQWFDGDLLTTFAYFTAEQENLSAFAGVRPSDGRFYYEGTNVDSRGIEIEVVGQLSENLNAVLGFTKIDVDDETGENTRLWSPRNTFNFTLEYKLPQLSNVNIGIGGKWQSDIKNTDFNIEQDAYLLVNAYARWFINDDTVIQANVKNLTDEKYINSLYNVGYYGAPLNASINLTYSF